MEIREKEVTAMDLLNLAFIGTAIEPHLPLLREMIQKDEETDTEAQLKPVPREQEVLE